MNSCAQSVLASYFKMWRGQTKMEAMSRSFQSRTFLEIAKQDKLFGAIGE
jgi:protein gp37